MNHPTPTALQREYDELGRKYLKLVQKRGNGQISGLNFVNKIIRIDNRRAAIGRILFQGADSAEQLKQENLKP